MKTNWEHQKKAITTDQKFRAEDEHLREIDKRHLKESEESPERIPRSAKSGEGEGADGGEGKAGGKPKRRRPQT